jgi:hypothetical protein
MILVTSTTSNGKVNNMLDEITIKKIKCWAQINTILCQSESRIRYHERVNTLCGHSHPPCITHCQSQYGNESLATHFAYGSVIICSCKQRHYSECKMREIIIFTVKRYNPAMSTFKSVVVLVLKCSHTQDMLLRLFVCIFTVLRPAQECFTYIDTWPLPVKGCKI